MIRVYCVYCVYFMRIFRVKTHTFVSLISPHLPYLFSHVCAQFKCTVKYAVKYTVESVYCTECRVRHYGAEILFFYCAVRLYGDVLCIDAKRNGVSLKDKTHSLSSG